MFLRRHLIPLIILLALILVKCGKKDDDVVARIGNDVVTLKKFEKEFGKANSKKTLDALKAAAMDEKNAFLQGIVEKSLKVLAAYQAELDKDEKNIEKVQAHERYIAYTAAIQVDVMEKLVSESGVREFYDHFNRQIKVRDIFLRRPRYPSIAKQREIEKKIEEIFARMNKEDFAKLASEYSEDEPTAKKGGDLGYLKWGERDVLRRAADSLKVGEVSDPIKTSQGYHIIKVEAIKKYLKDDYEEDRSKIVIYLSQKNKSKYDKLFEKYMEEVKKQYSAKYNDDNMRYYAQKLAIPKEEVDLRIKDDESSLSPVERRFVIFTDQDRKRVLVSYKGGEITVGDWVDHHIRNPHIGRPSYNFSAQVFIDETKKHLGKFVAYRIVVDKGFDNGLHETPQAQRELKRYKEDLMVREIEGIEVFGKIDFSEEDVQQYYQDSKDRYKIPEKVKVQEIYLKDKKLAQELAARAQGGENFSTLAIEYNERAATKNKDGMLGYITENRYGELGQQAFELEVGEIVGPIPMKKGYYSIIKLLDRKPSEFKTFEEVRPNVESYLRKELISKRKKDWMKELRSMFKVRVNNRALKRAFAWFEG